MGSLKFPFPSSFPLRKHSIRLNWRSSCILMNPKMKTVLIRLIVSRIYLLVFLSFFFCKPESVTVDFYPNPLPKLTGDSEALSLWKGKVIVLDFWATWCEPCAKAVLRSMNGKNRYRKMILSSEGSILIHQNQSKKSKNT